MSTEKKEEMSALDKILAQYTENTTPKATSGTTGGYDEKNYFGTFLTKEEKSKKYVVRVLPASQGLKTPFDEIYVHQIKVANAEKKSTFICLKKMEGKACPFCEANEVLFQSGKNGNDKDKELAKNYYARKMYVTKLVYRAAEGDGVKFWRFGHDARKEGVYDKIFGIIDSLKQDITDKTTGRDLSLNLARNQNGIPIINSITQLDPTPLSTSPELMEKWLSDTRTWRDVYGIKTYEYLEIVVKGGEPMWDKAAEKYVDKNASKEHAGDTSEGELTVGIEAAKQNAENVDNSSDQDELPF